VACSATAGADRGGAGAGRGRAEVQLVRVLLAGDAGPDLCGLHRRHFDPLKGIVTLLLGLLVACVGLENPAGHPRFTFGNAEMTGGIGLIPLMIGMFAISEMLRFVVDTDPPVILWSTVRSAM
jgi:hypothetical protein